MINIRIKTKEDYIREFLFNYETIDIVKYKDESNLIIDKTINKFIRNNLFDILDSWYTKVEIFNINKWVEDIKKDNLDIYINWLIEELYIHSISEYNWQNNKLVEIALYNWYYSIFNRIKEQFIVFLEEKKKEITFS